jgi:thioredoxin reductase (NADPH)
MTGVGEQASIAGNSSPVLLVVDADDDARNVTEAALQRRFGADYRVLAAGSGSEALGSLRELAARDEDVAVMAAELHLPDMTGLAFLEKAQAIFGDAARALLLPMDDRGTRIPFSALDVIRQATALGRIDFYIVKGWVSPEEGLYPQVQEALTRWTRSHGPHHEVMRIIGAQQSRESHLLRDALTRNTVPFGFYAIESEAGQRLAKEHSVDLSR